MKLKKLAVPILLAMPLFLMGNAPSPIRGPDIVYEEYAIEYFSCQEVEGKYNCSFDLVNTGEAYIALNSVVVANPDTNSTYTGYHGDNLLIEPDGVYNITFTSDTLLTLEDIYISQIFAYEKTYVKSDVIKINNLDSISKSISQEENLRSPFFNYDITISYEQLITEFGKYYSPVFIIKDGINDEIYHFNTYSTLQDSYMIQTEVDLNIEKLEIIDVLCIESYEYYRGGRGASNLLQLLLTFFVGAGVIYAIGIFGVVSLIGGIIFVIIFFSIRYVNKNNPKNHKNE